MSHATTAPQNHLSGHIGGWATYFVVGKEMLDGQRQRADDISACARLAHDVLAQKRLEENLC